MIIIIDIVTLIITMHADPRLIITITILCVSRQLL